MSRPADVIHREMLSLLPPGFVWPRTPDTLLGALLEPMAVMLAELEATAERMMDEVDPRTAVLCLEDFERVLGPDPCGRDTAAMTLAARQQLAHQRWTARGGQSIPYFVGLAAKRGVAASITEGRVAEVGAAEVDFELVEPPEQYVWIVDIPLGAWTDFYIGGSEVGEQLYTFQPADIECDIQRAAPAHTIVIFRYSPAEP